MIRESEVLLDAHRDAYIADRVTVEEFEERVERVLRGDWTELDYIIICMRSPIRAIANSS